MKIKFFIACAMFIVFLPSCITTRTLISTVEKNEELVLQGCKNIIENIDAINSNQMDIMSVPYESRQIQKLFQNKLKVDYVLYLPNDSILKLTSEGPTILNTIHHIDVYIGEKYMIFKPTETNSIYGSARNITPQIIYYKTSYY